MIIKEFSEDYDAGDYVYRYLIQYMDSQGDILVRITYYRRPKDGGNESWIFGGQYAPILPKNIYENLIKQTLNDRWLDS